MQTTRAIVFDAFGTLIRYTVRLSPYGRLLDESGRPMDRLACLTRDVPLATLAIEAGVGDEMDLMATDLAEELHGLRLFAEVPDVLAKARAAGLRLAVCSNLAHEYGPAVRGFVPDLDAYVLSYEVGVAKPDPTMYRLACAELGQRCTGSHAPSWVARRPKRFSWATASGAISTGRRPTGCRRAGWIAEEGSRCSTPSRGSFDPFSRLRRRAASLAGCDG